MSFHKSHTTAGPSSYLVPISGPPLDPIELRPRAESQVIGRHERCDLLLPADADKVSRYHARFGWTGAGIAGHWTVTDMNSRWGTFVNGRKLEPEETAHLAEGDLIRIVPWTFTLARTPQPKGIRLSDDSGQMQTMVRTIAPARAGIGEDMLSVLLESAAGIHGAQSEKALAELVLDAAVRGTGMRNATLLRPVGTKGDFEVIATRATDDGARYSRTLLAAAASGNVAEYSANDLDAQAPIANSITEMRVSTALCVPLMLGDAVAAFLYLDARGEAFRPRPNASAFCVGLGKIASLALANLKRIAMERRQASVEAELSAGAEAQRWIFPPRTRSFGKISYIGESRPGRYVGGDFFDVIELGDGRVAIALGDVAGKGIPASVLMTAAQGYLHSALLKYADLGEAVTALNQFICPRCGDGKFLTLWVGLIDCNNGTLAYIDAGHGYALTAAGDGALEQIEGASELPIGVDAEATYATQSRPLPAGSRLVIVSDGLVEQPGTDVNASKQFGIESIPVAIAGGKNDPVAGLFEAIIAFAGTSRLADDATALWVRVG